MLFRVIQDDESSSRDLARARGEIADHSRGPPAAPSMAGRQSVYLNTIEAAAARYSVKAMRIGVRDSAEIAPAIDAFATEPDGGVIVEPVVSILPSAAQVIDRLALQHRLPTFYSARTSVVAE